MGSMNSSTSLFSLTPADLAKVPPSEEVVALVRELLAGSQSAQAKFYEVFQPVIQNCIRKWNSEYLKPFNLPRFDTEDACQDALVKLIYGDHGAVKSSPTESVLTKWLDYEGPRRKSLYKYVEWNIHFQLMELRRTNQRKRSLLTDLSEEEPELTPEERLQLQRCANRCWKGLNPSHREVLEFVGLLGHTQAETARILGVGEATISRWLKDATRSFRHCLQDSCPEELLSFDVR
jgi:RNA polymerase sigma factor (sigma-70 family)